MNIRVHFLSILLLLVFITFSCQKSKETSLDETKHVSPKIKQTAQRLIEYSDLIVVGDITKIYDATPRDGGMSYNVKIEKIIHGDYNDQTLHFNSSGWIGYAEYKEGEKVLLFLKLFGLPSPGFQIIVIDGHQVICYIRDNIVEGFQGSEGPLGKLSLDRYIEIIKEAGK